MKVFYTFLFMLLVSTGITYFLTHKPSQKNQVIKPLSVSSFSMDEAPKDSLKGEIATMSGEVLWQSRVASEPAQLLRPRQVLQGENLVTKESGSFVLSFKDTAIITIAPNSEIDVIQTLPANFVFTQKSGTITFKKLGIIPISVKTAGLLIDQTEGTMTVSYVSELDTVTVRVTEGKAQTAFTDGDEKSQVANIQAGNAFVFDTSEKIGSIERLAL